MPYASTSNTSIYYETSGPEDGEPLLLIHGLSAQLVAWDPRFIEALESTGFRVIRFDNRDAGLSSRFTGDRAEYTLEDMAGDAILVLDHLGIQAAHIAGQSMGGVVAQQVAVDYPARTVSLCIIYSSHMFDYMLQDEEVVALQSLPPTEDREERIERYIAGERISGLDDLDDAYIRSVAELVVDRAWEPEGTLRQTAAVLRSSPRPERLRDIRVPTAIIHGRNDRLISFEASLEMGRLIPEAEVHILPGMGHQIRPSNWPDFLSAFRRNVDRARSDESD